SYITSEGIFRGKTNAYIREKSAADFGMDIFNRGLCLPSDNKMTAEQQDVVIDIVRRCFE
ncbi:MAG: aminotransferase DegT, partial [Lachnospiraceae bacterium]|nr:aminotransferase DegT [Lachnospiraceae bacterium]